MTAFLRSQLDRTRQPGFAQLAAGWCAPIGVIPSSGDERVPFDGTKMLVARDSRSSTTTGAAAGFGGRTP